jgi:hypothetical protein
MTTIWLGIRKRVRLLQNQCTVPAPTLIESHIPSLQKTDNTVLHRDLQAALWNKWNMIVNTSDANHDRGKLVKKNDYCKTRSTLSVLSRLDINLGSWSNPSVY